MYQHDPDAPDRRHPASKLWPPRHADSHGTCGLLLVARLFTLRPKASRLAKPRSVRAFGWARVNAVGQPAASDGRQSRNPKHETLGNLSVTLDDIKHFRQLDSKCPGHPEYRWTFGVETTTGPLGQGVANSVGMAIGGRRLGEYFNVAVFDYDVYALAALTFPCRLSALRLHSSSFSRSLEFTAEHVVAVAKQQLSATHALVG
jgi:hypothetical protein